MEEVKELLKNQIAVTTQLINREGQMLKILELSISDHEKRIRNVERILAYGTGAIGLGMYILKSMGKI